MLSSVKTMGFDAETGEAEFFDPVMGTRILKMNGLTFEEASAINKAMSVMHQRGMHRGILSMAENAYQCAEQIGGRNAGPEHTNHGR